MTNCEKVPSTRPAAYQGAQTEAQRRTSIHLVYHCVERQLRSRHAASPKTGVRMRAAPSSATMSAAPLIAAKLLNQMRGIVLPAVGAGYEACVWISTTVPMPGR